MPPLFVRARPALLVLLASVLASLIGPRSAHAQRRRDSVSITGGFAYGSLADKRSSRSSSGPVFGVRYAVGVSDHSRAALEYESQAFTLRHPSLDEHYTASFFLGAMQFYPTENFYLEPALGVQFRHWGGTARDVGADIGVAGAIAAGYELSLSRNVTFAPEVQLHYALVDPGIGLRALSAGLHVVIARRF